MLWNGNFAMNRDCSSAMSHDVVLRKLDLLLNEVDDVRQRYHKKLVEAKQIADDDLTRPLSHEEFTCLRQVWIDDTKAYMSDFDWTTVDSTCQDGIQKLKELYFESFFAKLSTVESVFAKFVCHAFAHDESSVARLLKDLSELPSRIEQPAEQHCKRRKMS